MTRRPQHPPAGPTVDRGSHGSSTGFPLRIAVDGRFLTDRYPGIGRYLFNLLSPLSRLAAPEPVNVLVDRRSRNTRFDLEELRRQGLRLTATGVPARHPAEQIVLPRWARSVGAQVLHVPFWWTARFLPCPLVVTIHDAIPLEVRQTLSAVKRWLYRSAARATARRADCDAPRMAEWAHPFDGVAPGYDSRFSYRLLGRWLRAQVQGHLRRCFAPGSRVLEMGCGTGHRRGGEAVTRGPLWSRLEAL